MDRPRNTSVPSSSPSTLPISNSTFFLATIIREVRFATIAAAIVWDRKRRAHLGRFCSGRALGSALSFGFAVGGRPPIAVNTHGGTSASICLMCKSMVGSRPGHTRICRTAGRAIVPHNYVARTMPRGSLARTRTRPSCDGAAVFQWSLVGSNGRQHVVALSQRAHRGPARIVGRHCCCH